MEAIAERIATAWRRRRFSSTMAISQPAIGDTLQALAAIAYADPLADPGKADLTAHVDFCSAGQVGQAARPRHAS